MFFAQKPLWEMLSSSLAGVVQNNVFGYVGRGGVSVKTGIAVSFFHGLPECHVDFFLRCAAVNIAILKLVSFSFDQCCV